MRMGTLTRLHSIASRDLCVSRLYATYKRFHEIRREKYRYQTCCLITFAKFSEKYVVYTNNLKVTDFNMTFKFPHEIVVLNLKVH